MLVMVNINMTHVFKHPKFYRIPRDKKDQVISDTSPTGASERAPGPGHKQRDSQVVNQVKLSSQSQASSSKPQASSIKHQAPRVKLSNQPVQAPSDKHPSQSNKRQASSLKLQAP